MCDVDIVRCFFFGRWICRCRCGLCFDVSRIWSGTIRRKSSSRQTSDDELDNMILATNGIPTVCSEVALNVDGNFLSECPHRAFSNQAFIGCLHESRSGAPIDVELTRSIAYAAAAPPAHFYDRLPSKQHRSKSIAF
uniref:Uncharacterized protein n=1 Tax=Ascaris lumbricoides TaxID=6252 RepID=A0A0M3HVN5_ASCLU